MVANEERPPIVVVGFLGAECFGRTAEAALRAADVVMGIPRLLDGLAADVGGKRIELAGPLAETLELAAERRALGERVCLLASGDPGFFGIVRVASARFGADGLEIHPAPSSPAVAFARAGLPGTTPWSSPPTAGPWRRPSPPRCPSRRWRCSRRPTSLPKPSGRRSSTPGAGPGG